MKCSIITVFILLSGIWLAQPIPVQATSGATSLVFQRATTATSATPNVRICTMTQTKGMVKELGETGDKMQTLICDTILGYYLGKKLEGRVACDKVIQCPKTPAQLRAHVQNMRVQFYA